MRILILLFISAVILSSSTCKKTTAGNTKLSVDSMYINRTGGFAGFNDHYLIANGRLYKDTNSRDQNYTPDYPMPDKNYQSAKILLEAITKRMFEENNSTYGTVVMDGITYSVTAYRSGMRYTWTILHDEPEYVRAFTQQLHNFFAQN